MGDAVIENRLTCKKSRQRGKIVYEQPKLFEVAGGRVFVNGIWRTSFPILEGNIFVPPSSFLLPSHRRIIGFPLPQTASPDATSFGLLCVFHPVGY